MIKYFVQVQTVILLDLEIWAESDRWTNHLLENCARKKTKNKKRVTKIYEINLYRRATKAFYQFISQFWKRLNCLLISYRSWCLKVILSSWRFFCCSCFFTNCAKKDSRAQEDSSEAAADEYFHNWLIHQFSPVMLFIELRTELYSLKRRRTKWLDIKRFFFFAFCYVQVQVQVQVWNKATSAGTITMRDTANL